MTNRFRTSKPTGLAQEVKHCHPNLWWYADSEIVVQYGALDSIQSIGAKVLMHALRPTADLEQLRAFPLAPPDTNNITPPAARSFACTFKRLFLCNICDYYLCPNSAICVSFPRVKTYQVAHRFLMVPYTQTFHDMGYIKL